AEPASRRGPRPEAVPQSAQREEDAGDGGNADGEERPDEEEGSAGARDRAMDDPSRCPEVDVGDERSEERSEEDEDIPRSPALESQRSVGPEDHDGDGEEVWNPSLLESAHDVVREVKRQEEDREQGGEG